LAWQETAKACSLARLNVGINIAVSKAIMDITTNNSINVNPLDFFIIYMLNFKKLFYLAGTGN
jgi:hypothetical protein